MALKKYSELTVQIDGIIQVELQDAQISFNPGIQPVSTIKKKLAGFTSGGEASAQVSFSSAVPGEGFEFDVCSACASEEIHTLTFTIGPKTYSGEGMFSSANAGQSQGGPVTTSGEWIGELKAFE